jgi:hypothetical protein
MSKKEEGTSSSQPNNAMGMFGDMSLLREIIMGPKVIEYEQRFSDDEDLIRKNEESTQQRFDALTKAMNERFDRFEQLLNQHVEQLDTQMKTMSKNDKAKISELLVEMSKKLIE